jgi:hypothetical protein
MKSTNAKHKQAEIVKLSVASTRTKQVIKRWLTIYGDQYKKDYLTEEIDLFVQKFGQADSQDVDRSFDEALGSWGSTYIPPTLPCVQAKLAELQQKRAEDQKSTALQRQEAKWARELKAELDRMTPDKREADLHRRP